MMEAFIWFLPSPAEWIRCASMTGAFGRVHVTTWDGREFDNLRARRIYGAVICEK